MKAVVRVDCLPREQRTAIRRACRDEIINHNRRMLKLAALCYIRNLVMVITGFSDLLKKCPICQAQEWMIPCFGSITTSY